MLLVRIQTILLPAALAFTGCAASTMNTRIGSVPYETVISGTAYRVLVSTGDTALDKFVYEQAFFEFGDLLPLSDKGDKAGTMEISFSSTPEGMAIASGTSYGTQNLHASGWYDGSGYWGGSASATGSATSVATASTYTWQNSTMLIVVKGYDSQRIWVGDYNYKGGYEMSGWVVNTPTEAARLILKRMAQRFLTDFKITKATRRN